jgi:ankyrin repeat protein
MNSLLRAVMSGDLSALQTVLELGGDPNVRDSEGMTPLMEAAIQGRRDLAHELVSVVET